MDVRVEINNSRCQQLTNQPITILGKYSVLKVFLLKIYKRY